MTYKAYRPILWAGFAAGTFDICAAFIVLGLRGMSPLEVLQSVASGWLGKESYNGGIASGVLGLVSHYFIATTAAVVYFFASRKLKILLERPVLCGLIYGVFVYLFMNFVVLPLSAFPHTRTYTAAVIARGMSIIMFCVGLPIAVIIRRHSSFKINERSFF
jgi:hypothetical protein